MEKIRVCPFFLSSRSYEMYEFNTGLYKVQTLRKIGAELASLSGISGVTSCPSRTTRRFRFTGDICDTVLGIANPRIQPSWKELRQVGHHGWREPRARNLISAQVSTTAPSPTSTSHIVVLPGINLNLGKTDVKTVTTF